MTSTHRSYSPARSRGLRAFFVAAPFVALVMALAPVGLARADETPKGGAGQRKALSLPGAEGGRTLELTAGAGSVFGKDELLLKEYVDIHYGDLRLQADTVRYLPATRDCFAEGNVILDNGPARITAEKVEYNLDTGLGVFHQARGYAEPSFYFEAEEVQKVDEDRYVIQDATFTTCTQPVPYWSFRVSRGTIHLDNYAYLHQVTLWAQRVPVFYSPYLVWPIKEDRATGLLFPEFGYSHRRGFVLSNAVYWAIRRNMDATLFLDYYALAGLGEGLEYRYVPSAHGRGEVTAAFIRDQVTDKDRYFMSLKHHQDLPNDFRLVADINRVSDFDYFLDFQRDLRASTSPLVLSYIYLTRNWSYYSFNVRTERRDQLSTVNILHFPDPASNTPAFTEPDKEEFTNRIQPSFDLRGSKQRLGNSPLYFAFESSLDSFAKETEFLSTSYQRLDLFPSFSAPLRLAPWLDINPSVGLRDTYYTERLGPLVSETLDSNGDGVPDNGGDVGLDGIPGTGDAGEGNGVVDSRQEVLDQDVLRKILIGSVEIIGPKFARIFQTPKSSFSPLYKNSFEPRVVYLYQRVSQAPGIIPFDEKDVVGGIQNSIQYSLTTRLFAKRPGSTPQAPETAGGGFFPSGSPMAGEAPAPSSPAPPAPEEKASLSPVEIASFSLAQSYSFLDPAVHPVRTAFNCPSVSGPAGTSVPDPNCLNSRLSDVSLQARLNPTLFFSVDAKGTYDIFFNTFRNGSLSANYRDPTRGFLNFSWFFQNALGPFDIESKQLGLLAGTNLLNRRLTVGFQGHYDVVQGLLQDQRYVLGYSTQCCGFTVELLDRNFSGFNEQQFRLMLNLKGIGNVLDINSGASPVPGLPVGF